MASLAVPAMLRLPVPRNPLAFPAGRAPGVNVNHPAWFGTCISAVPIGAGMINLAKGGVRQASANFNPGSDTYVGNGLVPTTTTPRVPFSGMPTTSMPFTFACIAREAWTNADDFFVNATAATGGIQISLTTSNILRVFLIGPSASVSSGIAPVSGVPYFIIVSGIYDGSTYTITFTFLRLDTGSIIQAQATASSATPVTAATGSGDYVHSLASAQGVWGPCMFSTGVYLPKAAQKMWAADPWGFWYPGVDVFNTMDGTASSSFLAAWATQRNTAYDGWAT